MWEPLFYFALVCVGWVGRGRRGALWLCRCPCEGVKPSFLGFLVVTRPRPPQSTFTYYTCTPTVDTGRHRPGRIAVLRSLRAAFIRLLVSLSTHDQGSVRWEKMTAFRGVIALNDRAAWAVVQHRMLWKLPLTLKRCERISLIHIPLNA